MAATNPKRQKTTTKKTTATRSKSTKTIGKEEYADLIGQIDAIGRSQATIEFNLDGTIIRANDNFLGAVGYTLEEIQGQHHRMFVEPTYAQSAEYTQFWEKLNRGEFASAEFKRIGKGGKEIWIQASYNPICDLNGKPFKIVKYASDITSQVVARQEQEACDKKIGEFQQIEVSRVSKSMAQIAAGDLQQEYVVSGHDGDTEAVHRTFSSIATALNEMRENLQQRETRDNKIAEFQKSEVSRVSTLMARIANGDLTQVYEVSDCDSDTEAMHCTFSSIAIALNEMCENLRSVIGSVKQNAQGLNATSSSLSATATQLANGAEETTTQSATVASAAEEMATNMRNMACSTEQMTTNVDTVAKSVEELTDSIGEIAKTAEQSSSIADRAADLTRASNETIGQLGSAAEEIGKVIEVIQDIAEQTNLLALNATIEAARAGDAGKGFAVVATEVKELARQTAGATEDIRNRIQVIQGSTTEAIESIREVGEVIDQVNETSGTIASAVEEQSILTKGIAENIKETAQQTSAVSVGVTESATACDEVARSISSVDESSRQTALGATETQTIGQSLSDLGEELAALVGQFSIAKTSASGSPVGAPLVSTSPVSAELAGTAAK